MTVLIANSRVAGGHYKVNFHNFIATSDRAGSANNFVYKSCVHIPDSYKLVEEIHVHLKIGGGYKECS